MMFQIKSSIHGEAIGPVRQGGASVLICVVAVSMVRLVGGELIGGFDDLCGCDQN